MCKFFILLQKQERVCVFKFLVFQDVVVHYLETVKILLLQIPVQPGVLRNVLHI